MLRIITCNGATATTTQNVLHSNTTISKILLQRRMSVPESVRIYSSAIITKHSPAVVIPSTCPKCTGLSSPMTALTGRHQSTTSTNAETVEKKKKKRAQRPHYAKYVELLEVTPSAANERKSRVMRLKAKKLQDFIVDAQQQILKKGLQKEEKINKNVPNGYQQIDTNSLHTSLLEASADGFDDKPLIFFGRKEFSKRVLRNPDEINNILGSFQNFRDVLESTIDHEEVTIEPNYESFSMSNSKLEGFHEELHDPLESPEPYISPETYNSTSLSNTKESKSKKSRFKSKIHSTVELERLAKERALRLNLHTYLNVCVSAGMLNRGFSTILTYRQRAKKSTIQNDNLVTIDLYNILLHGFAEKGSYERFKDIFSLIEDDGLQFNEQTFAAIFECLGRAEPHESNINEIRKQINKANNMGFTINDIMNRSKFVYDQRDIALDALQRVHPEFNPIYTPPNIYYDNPLLNKLNENVQSIDGQAPKETIKNSNVSSKSGCTEEQLQEMAREQLKVELEGFVTIKSIEKGKEYDNTELCREKLKEMEKIWHTQIMTAIRRDLNTLRAQVRFKPHGYMTYYTYLKALDTTQYADLLIKEIYRLAEGSETFSPTLGQLYKELGQKVQQKYQIEQKKKNGILEKVGHVYKSYCMEWSSGQNNDNTRQMWQRLVHAERKSGPSMDISELTWPPNVLNGVGRFLYNVLMRDIKIDTHIMRQKSSKTKKQNFLPAFYTLFRNHGRLVKEEVKPHPVLSRLLRASQQQTLTFSSNLVPMLCPPQPWSTPHNGGYLLNKSDLIRLPMQAVQQWDRINSANPQSIYPALDSLNQLASIPWRVNTEILDVIIEVFQAGGDHKLDVPQPPNSLPPLPGMNNKDPNLSGTDRAKLFREKLGHRRKQAEMYSLWCDALYRLSLANHYRNKVFWLPHNMDFRGRVYPLPPHLNHLGSDLARSMLVFDEAQPLGLDGFNWLKLHCINLTGLKKRDSVRERLLYAEEIMDDILDSADNPLTGRMWWSKSDEPWQTLACCVEIAKVHRCPNPEEYQSRFPVHQDGSCNGLQHYAALGRDKAGAFSVNLAPSTVPQDVYSAVAALVETSRKVDAKNGLLVANVLENFVRRKVIKQTVMTTVYGVTRYGARLQIVRQLKDIDEFPKDWVWPASSYLTLKTFESLREMFTSTREIQDWFTECARLISNTRSQNVEWVTPLGLPVVQPYNRQEVKLQRSSNCKVTETMPMDVYERPNVMKQKNAFPPNFIHSLDSSHMMLTSLFCEKQGLTFVSVHDCFWTHACTVPDMNRICREQFVALHSQPILQDLSKFLGNRFSFKDSDFVRDGSAEDVSKRNLNRVLCQVPPQGEFDLENVLKSIYFFS